MESLEFHHTDKGVWSVDASDLGLAPGFFPEEIVARVGKDEVRARLIAEHRDSARELTHVEYAPFGRSFRLLIWND